MPARDVHGRVGACLSAKLMPVPTRPTPALVFEADSEPRGIVRPGVTGSTARTNLKELVMKAKVVGIALIDLDRSQP